MVHPVSCFAAPLQSVSWRTGRLFCLSAQRVLGSRCPAVSRRSITRATLSTAVKTKTEHLMDKVATVVLKRGKARLFRDQRSGVVYDGAVASVIGAPENGDAVLVVDGAHEMVGYGLYNASSMFRVRMLKLGSQISEIDVSRDIEMHVKTAFKLRESLALPNPSCTAYRAINGAGDRLSGLVVDVFNDVLVAASSALWVERYRDVIIKVLQQVVPQCTSIVWRRSTDRLKQDGVVEMATLEALPHVQLSDDLEVVENGIKFVLPPRTLYSGQKTGHYTDQRDARQYIASITRPNSRVLDLFSYSGGFALAAARAGATATCVDSSAIALTLAETNAAKNRVHITTKRGDVALFLKEDDEVYDIVICDPPKLAPSAKSLHRATRKYVSLNAAALRRVAHGGLLLTCSCSAAVAREKGLFVDIIRKAAAEARVDISVLRRFGSGADHPVAPDAPDGDYLTAYLFAVHKWDMPQK